jgi:predicted lipid-binding transport protein (Tim44 family)
MPKHSNSIIVVVSTYFMCRSKQQAASSKQQAVSSKQQAASSKQQAASSKQQAASSKQQAAAAGIPAALLMPHSSHSTSLCHHMPHKCPSFTL